jgi:microcystin-dependent protein
MSSFDDYSTALRMKALLKSIVAEEVEALRPTDKFGVVKSIAPDGKAQVILDGDGIPISVRWDPVNKPISTLDVPNTTYEGGVANRVRITGRPGNYWITQIIRGHSAVTVAGAITAFAGTGAPGGWLICDGSSLLKIDYPDLFGVIGTTYGSTDEDHFSLPDLRGRVPVGRDTQQAPFHDLGNKSGEINHTLSVAEMPVHSHGGSTGTVSSGHTHNFSTGTNSADHSHGMMGSGKLATANVSGTNVSYVYSGGASQGNTSGISANHTHSGTTGDINQNHTHSVAAQGSGGAHNNLQPYIVLNYIIKT